MKVTRNGVDRSTNYTPEEIAAIRISFEALDGEPGQGSIPIPDTAGNLEAYSGESLLLEDGAVTITDGWIGAETRVRGPSAAGTRRVPTFALGDSNAMLHGHATTGWSRPAESPATRWGAFLDDFVEPALGESLDRTYLLTTNESGFTCKAKVYRSDNLFNDISSDTVESTGKTAFVIGREFHWHLATEGEVLDVAISDSAFDYDDAFPPDAATSPQRSKDMMDLRNQIFARNAKGQIASVSDSTSITRHNSGGLRHQSYSEFNDETVAEMTLAISATLASSKEERITYECDLGPMDASHLARFKPGGLLNCTSAIWGLSSSTQRLAHVDVTPLTPARTGHAQQYMLHVELGYPIRIRRKPPRTVNQVGPGGNSPAPIPPGPYAPPPTPDPHFWSGSIDITGSSALCASYGYDTAGKQLVAGQSYVVHFEGHWENAELDAGSGLQQGTFQIGIGHTTTPAPPCPDSEQPNDVQWTWHAVLQDISQEHTVSTSAAASTDLAYAFGGVLAGGLSAANGHIDFWVDPTGWVAPDPVLDSGPSIGQTVAPEVAGTGDGSTTAFQTNYPYAPGSLDVFANGVRVVPTETDATTGSFALPFAPSSGTQITIGYVASSNLATGATNTQPVSELDLVDSAILVADHVQYDNSTSGLAATDAQAAIDEIVAGGALSSGLAWFNVKDYGAVGNATTDDTSAINGAIAALIAAGQGVLYFPAATAYKCSSALTTLSVPCTVLGDGGAGDPIYSNPVSQVRQTSATANLFTVSATGVAFQNISLRNIAGSTPSAGAGISFASASWARIENCTISRFYDDISITDGIGWTLTNTFIYDPVRYGIRVQGTLSPDNGDQSIVGCYFMADSHAGSAAIRYESAGGLKIANTKINNRTNSFVHGIDLAIPTSVDTGVLHVTGCSIENVTGDAIHGTTSAATSKFSMISLIGLEVALYGNNTGRAVSLVATTAADFADIVIDGCNFRTDGTARAAVAITNVDNITFGDIQLTGFNARYTATTSTNITDSTSVSYATPSIALGSSAAAGAASTVIRSDSTIAAFDASAPTTQALGDSATVGSAAFAARRDHRHGMPALSTATPLVEAGSGAVGTGTASSREDHVHPAVTGTGTDHEHIGGITFSGDGSTTAFELPAAPFDTYSVAAYVAGVRVGQSLSGTLLTTLTFDSAPASGTDNIVVDIAAAAA